MKNKVQLMLVGDETRDLSKTISSPRVVATVARSWVCFVLAMAAMIVMMVGCFLVVARFAPGMLRYFTYGMISATAVGLITLILNEPLVRWLVGMRRVRSREDCPKLWDAAQRVTPWFAKPFPRVYLIPTGGMNACAFGWGIPLFSAVAATQGLVDGVEEEELAAVMAHEVGHIANKDILISTLLSIMVMMAAFTGWSLWRLGPYASSSRNRSSSSSSSRGNGAVAILVVMLVGLALYFFGRLFGYVLQMFVSRQREYAADATSAWIMGSPRPLISALQKIVRNPGIGVGTKAAAIGFMFNVDPQPDDLIATHPSLENRIRALEALES